MRRYVLILWLAAMSAGCSTEPAYTWSKSAPGTNQTEADMAACEAEAYKTVGSPPQGQKAPDCESSFGCGMSQGATVAQNHEAREAWESARDAAFRSCMFERGYSQIPSQ
jgi:hypothetical protein